MYEFLTVPPLPPSLADPFLLLNLSCPLFLPEEPRTCKLFWCLTIAGSPLSASPFPHTLSSPIPRTQGTHPFDSLPSSPCPGEKFLPTPLIPPLFFPPTKFFFPRFSPPSQILVTLFSLPNPNDVPLVGSHMANPLIPLELFQPGNASPTTVKSGFTFDPFFDLSQFFPFT